MKISRVNIGEIIKKEVEKQGISFAAFAKQIGIQRQNVESTIFGKSSIDTDRLSLISEILGRNFFDYYKDYDECNKNNYSDDSNEIKEVGASVIIQVGQEKKEEKFTFRFGKNI